MSTADLIYSFDDALEEAFEQKDRAKLAALLDEALEKRTNRGLAVSTRQPEPLERERSRICFDILSIQRFLSGTTAELAPRTTEEQVERAAEFTETVEDAGIPTRFKRATRN